MGIHLKVYRVNGILLDGDEEYIDKSIVEEHDSTRYALDKEFVWNTKKTFHPVDGELWRPINTEQAIFVAKNFCQEAGFNRLLDSLLLLKQNEDYWFKTSY